MHREGERFTDHPDDRLSSWSCDQEGRGPGDPILRSEGVVSIATTGQLIRGGVLCGDPALLHRAWETGQSPGET